MGGRGADERKKRKTVFLHEVFAQRLQEWRQVVKGKATAGSVVARRAQDCERARGQRTPLDWPEQAGAQTAAHTSFEPHLFLHRSVERPHTIPYVPANTCLPDRASAG